MTMAISSVPLLRHVWPCCHCAALGEIHSLRLPFIAGMVWVDTNACSCLTFLGQEQLILGCVEFLPPQQQWQLLANLPSAAGTALLHTQDG